MKKQDLERLLKISKKEFSKHRPYIAGGYYVDDKTYIIGKDASNCVIFNQKLDIPQELQAPQGDKPNMFGLIKHFHEQQFADTEETQITLKELNAMLKDENSNKVRVVGAVALYNLKYLYDILRVVDNYKVYTPKTNKYGCMFIKGSNACAILLPCRY